MKEKILQALHSENERLGLYKDAYAQPEQEPVAWMDADGNVSDNNDHKCFPIPLYTTPPQRKPMTEWQPIETALKDGTYILLGSTDGAWVASYKPVYQSGYRPEDPWHSMMLNHEHMGRYPKAKPTHWQPLPLPPAAPSSAQPEQEPVAYLCENAVGHKYFRWKKPSSTYKPIALYTTPPQRKEPPDWFHAVENILNEYGLQAIDFVADFKAAMKDAEHSQRTEQNFCSRCGKRVGGINSIHTCTPPMEKNT